MFKFQYYLTILAMESPLILVVLGDSPRNKTPLPFSIKINTFTSRILGPPRSILAEGETCHYNIRDNYTKDPILQCEHVCIIELQNIAIIVFCLPV